MSDSTQCNGRLYSLQCLRVLTATPGHLEIPTRQISGPVRVEEDAASPLQPVLPAVKADDKTQNCTCDTTFFFFLEQNKFLYFKSAHFKQVRKYIHMITQLPATDQHHFLLSLCASVHFWTNIWKSIKPINLIFRGNSSSDPGKTWLYFEKNCP